LAIHLLLYISIYTSLPRSLSALFFWVSASHRVTSALNLQLTNGPNNKNKRIFIIVALFLVVFDVFISVYGVFGALNNMIIIVPAALYSVGLLTLSLFSMYFAIKIKRVNRRVVSAINSNPMGSGQSVAGGKLATDTSAHLQKKPVPVSVMNDESTTVKGPSPTAVTPGTHPGGDQVVKTGAVIWQSSHGASDMPRKISAAKSQYHNNAVTVNNHTTKVSSSVGTLKAVPSLSPPTSTLLERTNKKLMKASTILAVLSVVLLGTVSLGGLIAINYQYMSSTTMAILPATKIGEQLIAFWTVQLLAITLDE
jgi:hypothetical protein